MNKTEKKAIRKEGMKKILALIEKHDISPDLLAHMISMSYLDQAKKSTLLKDEYLDKAQEFTDLYFDLVEKN